MVVCKHISSELPVNYYACRIFYIELRICMNFSTVTMSCRVTHWSNRINFRNKSQFSPKIPIAKWFHRKIIFHFSIFIKSIPLVCDIFSWIQMIFPKLSCMQIKNEKTIKLFLSTKCEFAPVSNSLQNMYVDRCGIFHKEKTFSIAHSNIAKCFVCFRSVGMSCKWKWWVEPNID